MLPISSVPRSLLTFLSWNCCLCSTLAFLIEIIFSWTVSRVPEEVNDSSPNVVALSGLLFSSFVRENNFVPVSNRGWLRLFGFGKNKLPWTSAAKSLTSLTSLIVAWAPLVLPVSFIPVWTQPKNSPCASCDSEYMSTFKIVDVDEYDPPNGLLS